MRALLAGDARMRRREAWFGIGSPDTCAEDFEERLLVCSRVGLLDGAEREAWRDRFREAGEPFAPWPDEIVSRARQHAEDAVAAVSRNRRDLADAAFGVLAGFEDEGVLPFRETRRLRDRLVRRLSIDPQRPPCSRVHLIDVLPGPGHRVDGVLVTAVERYSDGVVLRWHEATPSASEAGVPQLWDSTDQEIDAVEADRWSTLTDDLGTRYRGGGGSTLGINGGAIVRFGEATFAPAVPPGARRLGFAGALVAIDQQEH